MLPGRAEPRAARQAAGGAGAAVPGQQGGARRGRRYPERVAGPRAAAEAAEDGQPRPVRGEHRPRQETQRPRAGPGPAPGRGHGGRGRLQPRGAAHPVPATPAAPQRRPHGGDEVSLAAGPSEVGLLERRLPAHRHCRQTHARAAGPRGRGPAPARAAQHSQALQLVVGDERAAAAPPPHRGRAAELPQHRAGPRHRGHRGQEAAGGQRQLQPRAAVPSAARPPLLPRGAGLVPAARGRHARLRVLLGAEAAEAAAESAAADRVLPGPGARRARGRGPGDQPDLAAAGAGQPLHQPRRARLRVGLVPGRGVRGVARPHPVLAVPRAHQGVAAAPAPLRVPAQRAAPRP